MPDGNPEPLDRVAEMVDQLIDQVIGLLVLAIVIPLMAYKTRWVKPGDEVEPPAEGENDA